MISYRWLYFILFLLSTRVEAQEIPLGTWRSHFNYSDSRLLVNYSGKVYVAANNGLFYLDLQDNSVNKLTKNDGLGDVGITAMAVTPDGSKLILGYSSGHIDILEDNNLSSINTIKNASAYLEKQINDIIFNDDLAYLSTDFGLVALDYTQGEVIESYGNIGEDGSNLEVYGAAVFKDSIFLTTSNGLMSTLLSPSNNLLDFNNWKGHENIGQFPEGEVSVIASYNGKLFVGLENNGLYQYDGLSWENLDLPSLTGFQRLKVERSTLYIIVKGQGSNQVFSLNAQNELALLTTENALIASDLVEMDDGAIWVADQERGLVADINGRGESAYPDGPQSDNIDVLLYFDEKILGIERSIDRDFNVQDVNPYLSFFTSGRWTNYTKKNFDDLNGISGFTDATFSSNTNEVFLGTFGEGIFNFNARDEFAIKAVKEGQSPFLSNQITALSANEDGSLWASEYGSPDNAYSFVENVWRRFPLNADHHVLDLLAIPFQNVWLRLSTGLLVLDPETGATTTLTAANQNLINSTVTAMAYDDNGFLWYGTASGVAYITNPGDVLEEQPNNIVPVYQNDDLLKNQRIDAIAVDPANRKWMATEEGLWLFTEDGDSLIHHFTAENSPLASNRIRQIEINPVSGEVYIATAKGLVSYRSNASVAKSSHDQVKIFPNPVRPGYSGVVGITGVVSGANVKITDLTGNLVREINAEGGTATWDGKTLSGDRVKTGIYLVFSSSRDGKETFIGKLAFLN